MTFFTNTENLFSMNLGTRAVDPIQNSLLWPCDYIHVILLHYYVDDFGRESCISPNYIYQALICNVRYLNIYMIWQFQLHLGNQIHLGLAFTIEKCDQQLWVKIRKHCIFLPCSASNIPNITALYGPYRAVIF